MQLSIIIPIYNEGKIISDSIKQVSDFFNGLNLSYEIIAVNDGSNDNTLDKLQQIATKTSVLQFISYPDNVGKGHAVKTGVLAARGDWILFMDADLSTPLESYSKFIKYVPNFDILIGSRAVAGAKVLVRQKIIKELLGKLGNKVIKIVLGIPFNDTQCGFKMYRRGKTLILFEQMRLGRWGFDFELLFLARKKKLNISEIPVNWSDDGRSAVRNYEYILTLRDLFRVRWWYLMGKYKI